jgi:hypothetical protein
MDMSYTDDSAHDTLGKLSNMRAKLTQYVSFCATPTLTVLSGQASTPHKNVFTRAGKPKREVAVNSSGMRVGLSVGVESNPTMTRSEWQSFKK